MESIFHGRVTMTGRTSASFNGVYARSLAADCRITAGTANLLAYGTYNF